MGEGSDREWAFVLHEDCTFVWSDQFPPLSLVRSPLLDDAVDPSEVVGFIVPVSHLGDEGETGEGDFRCDVDGGDVENVVSLRPADGVARNVHHGPGGLVFPEEGGTGMKECPFVRLVGADAAAAKVGGVASGIDVTPLGDVGGFVDLRQSVGDEGGEGGRGVEDLFEDALGVHPDRAVVDFTAEGCLEEVQELQRFDGGDEFEAGN